MWLVNEGREKRENIVKKKKKKKRRRKQEEKIEWITKYSFTGAAWRQGNRVTLQVFTRSQGMLDKNEYSIYREE